MVVSHIQIALSQYTSPIYFPNMWRHLPTYCRAFSSTACSTQHKDKIHLMEYEDPTLLLFYFSVLKRKSVLFQIFKRLSSQTPQLCFSNLSYIHLNKKGKSWVRHSFRETLKWSLLSLQILLNFQNLRLISSFPFT